MDGLTVVRRSSSPLVIYFFRTQTEPRSTFEFSAPANPEDSFDVFGMFDFTEENGADGNVP